MNDGAGKKDVWMMEKRAIEKAKASKS